MQDRLWFGELQKGWKKNQSLSFGDENMIIKVLTDNRVRKRGLLAEHGLSLYIVHGDQNVLFDVGQSNVYCHNAKKMDLDLRKTDTIVLSHGHYDHCMGLPFFPSDGKLPPIYVNRRAFQKKYASDTISPQYRDVGITFNDKEYSSISSSIVFTGEEHNVKGYESISEDIFLIGNISEITDFENESIRFYTGDDYHHDNMDDEQILIMKKQEGLVVFTGCSHKGIVNIIENIKLKFPEENIYAVVGGMHLENASKTRIERTINYLMSMNLKYLIPLHCTGIKAMVQMKEYFKERCLLLCAGDSLEI